MSEKDLKEKVENLLMENLVTGYSKSQEVEYTFIKPSSNRYSYQYFWDTCFHVYILCAIDKSDLAKKCFKTLFAMQEESGFVGHIHYWNNVYPARITDIFQNKVSLGRDLLRTHMSSLIQPPLVAQTLQKIWETTKDRDYLEEMLPKIKKYFEWLSRNRDFDDDGLLSIISPFESGMDWKASYDPVLGFSHGKANKLLFWKVVGIDFRNFWRNYDQQKIRRRDKFRIEDAGFNTIYAQNLKALGDLCNIMEDRDAAKYKDRYKKVKDSILKLMYDEPDAAFYDLYSEKNKKLRILTPTIFFPVIIDGMPDDVHKKVMERHFFNENEFHTKYPIPSLAINDPAFNPHESMYIWRGPTWIFNNWFMHQFMLEKGYNEEARHLIDAIVNLVDKSGFREYYNPFNGEGYGARNFTWAGLVLDMIQMHESHTNEKFDKGT
ncbi:amylo-alpha-1,6-glucosidase [Christiangramia crocea]|uniref:Trehalase-like protein n=1 Tax=Christiangramia crocea TaxID=2904124 RepID=A0A9X1V0H5_9FLAO|nr:trehalase family glycosidase [Gramella crocea]MCG9972598.1 trehalase-like protein [Gramella crocea]